MFCNTTGKTVYPTAGEARAAIQGQRRDGKTNVDLFVYECGDHFHLSKQVQLNAKRPRPQTRAPKAEPMITKAEFRHLKNRVKDLGRQIANDELKALRQELKRLEPTFAADIRWLAENALATAIALDMKADMLDSLRAASALADRHFATRN
ncbi:MAG TPA: hypothetical protein VNW47_09455 [Terriglobales bacterium]|jgi:hypothetical protein|nr:hypothetical protein [Terriglobales bacterium]